MDVLNEAALDKLELYQILVHVFFDYIPDQYKLEALAEAALIVNDDFNRDI